MNMFSKLVMCSSILVGAQFASAAAMAQAAPDGVLTGSVLIQKSLTTNCDLVITLNASDDLGTIEALPGDAFCAVNEFRNTPYTTSYNPATGALTFHSVELITFGLGDCAGDLSSTWDGTILIIDSFLPPATGGSPCRVEGFAL